MNNTIVMYHNDVNKLSFKGFSAADFNIFMAICSQVKNQDTKEVILPYSELKKLAGLKKDYTLDQFDKRLQLMNKKLMKIDYTIVEEHGAEVDFVFFPTFKRDKESQTLTVQINEHGAYLLNELVKNFTAFELEQYVSLDSKYAKTLFRLLKQYRTTGEYFANVNAFREVLGVPDSYTSRDVTQIVIKPSVEALQPIFKGLRYEITRAEKRRGRPILGYSFYFEPEDIKKKSDKDDEGYDTGETCTPQTQNRFNNFEQHKYNFKELENNLLSD